MLSKQALQDQAYEYLLNAIHAGEFEDGVMYSETQITESLHISRTPIHSALQQLQKDGYVDIYPSRGFMIHGITREDLREAFQTCIAEEAFCSFCLSAAENRDETLRALNDSLARQADHAARADVPAFAREDREFHGLIIRSLHNRSFQASFTIYRYRIKNFLNASLCKPGALTRSLAEHRELVAAISSGDSSRVLALLMQHHNDFN